MISQARWEYTVLVSESSSSNHLIGNVHLTQQKAWLETKEVIIPAWERKIRHHHRTFPKTELHRRLACKDAHIGNNVAKSFPGPGVQGHVMTSASSSKSYPPSTDFAVLELPRIHNL